MSYLKTLLTYRVPGEAEVDKSLLESHGIAVNLLNDRSPPSDLVFPFAIELQVAEERYTEAFAILKEFNPERFGSAERVMQLEKALWVSVRRFLAAGVVLSVLAWFIVGSLVDTKWFDWRVVGAAGGFFVGGYIAVKMGRKKNA
jgi:hypothetical protein